jgi:hypothetical protein
MFLCRRHAVGMDDHCGLLGHTQCYSCRKLEAKNEKAAADPKADGDHYRPGRFANDSAGVST